MSTRRRNKWRLLAAIDQGKDLETQPPSKAPSIGLESMLNGPTVPRRPRSARVAEVDDKAYLVSSRKGKQLATADHNALTQGERLRARKPRNRDKVKDSLIYFDKATYAKRPVVEGKGRQSMTVRPGSRKSKLDLEARVSQGHSIYHDLPIHAADEERVKALYDRRTQELQKTRKLQTPKKNIILTSQDKDYLGNDEVIRLFRKTALYLAKRRYLARERAKIPTSRSRKIFKYTDEDRKRLGALEKRVKRIGQNEAYLDSWTDAQTQELMSLNINAGRRNNILDDMDRNRKEGRGKKRGKEVKKERGEEEKGIRQGDAYLDPWTDAHTQELRNFNINEGRRNKILDDMDRNREEGRGKRRGERVNEKREKDKGEIDKGEIDKGEKGKEPRRSR